MDALNTTLAEVFDPMPDVLCRSFTWDQGREIAGHAQLARATGLEVYLCDPHSPWQRGTNENTNGLLRQWFPRSTNFYTIDRSEIATVADLLNGSPQPNLEWRTPAEALRAVA